VGIGSPATGLSRQCAVCGADELAVRFRVAGDAGPQGLIPTTDSYGTALSDIVRCATCGHMQLERFPDDAELAGAYRDAESADYIAEEAGQRETARRLLELIERHTRPGALLDVGCWTGFLLAEARLRGWAVTGVEPSEFAAAYARAQLDLDVRSADLMSAELPERRFDAIVMGDVIEHLVDPAAALARARELLRDGGVLCIVAPDAGSLVALTLRARWWSVIPTHVQYFTRASLARLLRRCGFRVIATATAPKVFSVRYYLDRVGGYSPRLARVLVNVAERVGVSERMWGPDFRDRMVMLATAEQASTTINGSSVVR
jgi:SAM-dependent methyltransferase